MSFITKETVQNALRTVIDPDSGQDVVSAQLISGLAIKDGKVGFILTVEPSQAHRKIWMREACEKAVSAIPGVTAVTAVLTAQSAEPIPPRPEAGYAQPRERAQWNLTPVAGVKRVIAIASGKGGVGKSTTAVNLALALHDAGKRVGLLDADIYGPSLPRMMGLPVAGKPDIVEGKMLPPETQGIACMSMGFLTGDEAAILRGPMISKTLHQLLRFTSWGELDTLLVDMPPGTGDIHLSMAQQVPMDGVIIVTTPQEIAVMDARKCLHMFQKLNVPILGIVENMSWFMDASGAKLALFGEGGGKRLAEECQAPFLGDIPLDPSIRENADSGRPYGGAYRDAYAAIASRI